MGRRFLLSTAVALVSFLMVVIKYSKKKQFEEEMTYSGSQFKVLSIMVGKLRWQHLEAVGHILSIVKRRMQ